MEEITKVFGIEWKLLLVQVINFGILLFILKHFLYRPILKIIDDRKGIAEKGVLDAKLASESLNKAEVESKEIQNKAKDEARAFLSSTKTEAIEMKEKLLSEAEKDKAKVIKEAEILANRMQEEAIVRSKESISQMAVLAAEKILKEKH